MHTDRPSVCPERLRLINEFSENTRSYSQLVIELRDLIENGLEWEADLLRRKCRHAWDSVELARLAVFRHEADHRCARCYPSAGRASRAAQA